MNDISTPNPDDAARRAAQAERIARLRASRGQTGPTAAPTTAQTTAPLPPPAPHMVRADLAAPEVGITRPTPDPASVSFMARLAHRLANA